MPLPKLQNIVIRTMRSDLGILESGGTPGNIKKSSDQAEEFLKRAKLIIDQAESERGAHRPAQKIKEKEVAPIEQDLNVLQEKVRLKAEQEEKEEALLEAEKKKAEGALLEAEKKKAEEARLEAEKKKAEEARLEAEKKKAEEARLEAEKKKAEEARLEAEKKKAEEARLEAEKKKAEEARLEVERRKAEEARQIEIEKMRREKVLSEAEATAQAWHIFGDIEEINRISELLALKEQEIESISFELKNFPVQEKSILPEKKRASDQKIQLEEEYQKLLSRLEEIKQSRENIEQLEGKARSGEERRRYEEERWQLVNRQKEIEQEKWNKMDTLTEITATLDKLEKESTGLVSQKDQLEEKLKNLNLEKQEIMLRQEKIQIRQKLVDLSLEKEEPINLIERLEKKKNELRSELQPILAEEGKIEKRENELKKRIETAINDHQKKELTEERWRAEEERERVEKERWAIEQKAIALRNEYQAAITPYQNLLSEERSLYQRLRNIDVLIAYGIDLGQKKLEERSNRIKEIRSLRPPQIIDFPEESPDEPSSKLDFLLDKEIEKIEEEAPEKPKDETPSKKSSSEKRAEVSPETEVPVPEIHPIKKKTPPVLSGNEEIERKKKEAREKLEEEMIERRKAMELKQAKIEEERQVAAPTPDQVPEQKVASSPPIPQPIPEPKSARETFINNLMASSTKEEAEREKFLKRVQGEEELPIPPGNKETVVQEGVVFRPVPQSPDKGHKVISRILIVLLIIGLGVVAYLIFRGYLL